MSILIDKETRVIFSGWDWTEKRAEKAGEFYRGTIRADGEAWVPFALNRATPTPAPF